MQIWERGWRHGAGTCCGLLLCLAVAATAAAPPRTASTSAPGPLLSRAAGRRTTALVGVAKATTDAAAKKLQPIFTPPPATGFVIDGLVMLQSTDAIFVNSSDDNPAYFTSSVAKRLHLSTGVPMARFTVLMKNPAQPNTPGASLFCASQLCKYSAGPYTARYAGEFNASFVCKELTHHLNNTVTPDAPHFAPAPQSHLRSMLLQSTGEDVPTVRWEVGVLPPTAIDGDTKSGAAVAAEIVRDANGAEEPEREMIPASDGSWNGHWEYEAGPSVRFLAMFPSTAAAFPMKGMSATAALSQPLGSLLGGRGAEAPPTTTPPPPRPPPGMTTAPPQVITELIRDAHKSNLAVYASIKELDGGLRRASAAHRETLNGFAPGPYKPSYAEPSAPLLPEWP